MPLISSHVGNHFPSSLIPRLARLPFCPTSRLVHPSTRAPSCARLRDIRRHLRICDRRRTSRRGALFAIAMTKARRPRTHRTLIRLQYEHEHRERSTRSKCASMAILVGYILARRPRHQRQRRKRRAAYVVMTAETPTSTLVQREEGCSRCGCRFLSSRYFRNRRASSGSRCSWYAPPLSIASTSSADVGACEPDPPLLVSSSLKESVCRVLCEST